MYGLELPSGAEAVNISPTGSARLVSPKVYQLPADCYTYSLSTFSMYTVLSMLRTHIHVVTWMLFGWKIDIK